MPRIGSESCARLAGLPDFECPPVVETVLGVSFHDVPEMDTVLVGRLWDRHFAADFSSHEEAAPYHVPIERFSGGRTTSRPTVELEVGRPARRHLFSNGNGIIQVQRDWFAYNWRKAPTLQEYERYEAGRERFERYYSLLEEFVFDMSGEALRPAQCEITYVNHIEADNESVSIGDVLVGLETEATKHLPLPEHVELSSSYMLGQPGGTQGRLHVDSATQVNSRTGHRRIVLALTVRGAPETPELTGILDFFDQGRKWIVHGFCDITTESMHQRWRKKPEEVSK